VRKGKGRGRKGELIENALRKREKEKRAANYKWEISLTTTTEEGSLFARRQERKGIKKDRRKLFSIRSTGKGRGVRAHARGKRGHWLP